MNEFEDEYKDILIRLAKADVYFMIVGGFAVIYHGYVRTTGDLDLWLQPQNSNIFKTRRVGSNITLMIKRALLFANPCTLVKMDNPVGFSKPDRYSQIKTFTHN